MGPSLARTTHSTVGRRVADARWAGRDAHLTAARPIVREFGFLRLEEIEARAASRPRAGECQLRAGETSQAESPDAHGPLEAQKIFPLVWQFVVHLVHDTIDRYRVARCDFHMEPSHRKLG